MTMAAGDLVLPAAAVISSAGMLIHNLLELPGQTPLSPESLIPLLVTVLLVAGWFTPLRRPMTVALLAWALLHMVGGGLSVLPLPILPFEPAQTPGHYLSHAVYAASQLPLIISAAGWLRSHQPRGRREHA